MSTPYLLEINDAYSYEFVTDQSIRYLIYFRNVSYLFEEFPYIHSFIYEFNIEVLDGDPDVSIEDLRVSLTILEAFARFFSAVENVAVYVCDSLDDRQVARNRKFNIWFFRLSDGSIIKKNGSILVGDTIIYNSILVHKDNVERDEIIQAFEVLNGRLDK